MERDNSVPLVPLDEAKNESRVKREFWPKFLRVAAKIPFAQDLLAAYYCARDPATPKVAKATLMGALVYFIMPTDLIPDFIVSLGFTDDAAVLLMVVNILSAHIKEPHRAKAKTILASTLGREIDEI